MTKEDLKKKLDKIDGKGYKAYKDLEGEYEFEKFILYIDHVQGDPFAPPSRIRVKVPQNIADFEFSMYNNPSRQVALEDFLTRSVFEVIKRLPSLKGTGHSGDIYIDKGGQQIIKRSAMVVNKDYVEARLSIGLPAFGRRINGSGAQRIFLEFLPQIVEKSLLKKSLNVQDIWLWVETVEDQDYLRSQLKERGLVAFVADGAILPRESGISDRPLKGGNVVPFESPDSLRIKFQLPNRGEITGMGIPEGVTLIVGGGYHGKSTLLQAIQKGVYNHIPGDGREFVITVADAVKIRAEDGRRIEKVDISPFINNLPNNVDTTRFTTENASGSTSQAANIIEAIEIGTSLLLLDEDTSATNFMIRDARMQKLIAKKEEPITPFIDRVKQLYKDNGISTILVMGGSGDYFDVANCVIKMHNYRPYDVTQEAKKIAKEFKTNREVEGNNEPIVIKPRIPLKKGLEVKGKKIKSKDEDTIKFGYQEIELDYVEQLVDKSQTNAIGEIIRYIASKYVDEKSSIKEILKKVYKDIYEKGLDVVSSFYGKHPGNLALSRLQEVAAALNRLRSFTVK
ncbi:putative ATPase of the ABC class [Thermoanaerobacter thermohydrosulfuricus WC1]|uniref:Putative ATPase of the ABC class n=1 Tax=Thermoanaerobacter thermohydrosulfuricus WC1 TaxID=1198630 RepID=M8CW40_THETY|nr:ABC-ATPase domain-containing protein [Thermoanaerobacter thermohydrosulfuricus]EMT38614.1 putative ATPase of the ABC class [Thermoanaerobacter thermohydrosulfuricus WC1]